MNHAESGNEAMTGVISGPRRLQRYAADPSLDGVLKGCAFIPPLPAARV
ncbi:hypothetical protein [Singulisphaera sp. PoT]